MAGNEKLGYDQAAFDKLSLAEKSKIDITLFSTEHLGLQTLLMDLLVPMFLSWVSGKISDQGADLQKLEHKKKMQVALLGQLFSVLDERRSRRSWPSCRTTSSIPTTASAARSPTSSRTTWSSWWRCRCPGARIRSRCRC